MVTPLLLTIPLMASTIPALGDRPGLSLGVAFEPSLGVDLTLESGLTVGASASLSALDPQTRGSFLFDAYGLVPVAQLENLKLSLIGGLWGDTLYLKGGTGLPLGVEGGIGVQYRVSQELTFRLNAVAAYGFAANALGRNMYPLPPAAGLEISYRVDDHLSVTLGYNGHGDILGLRWRP